ncbi:MAG: hypothetical protein WAM39_20270 [Bryobacteraceae bacterium]
MLWTKAWLETRWRLLYAVALPVSALALPYIMGGGVSSAKDARGIVGVMAFFGIFNGVYLAGAGIRTQPTFSATKTLSGSMYYTLSLPVSRLRMLSVRAGVGLLEFAGVSAVMYSAAWLSLPLVQGGAAPFDLLKLILAAVCCTACFYFVSVLLATFLDDPAQTFASMFVSLVVWFIVARTPPPRPFNLLGFSSDASPLVTHTMPWPAMVASLIFSAILFFVALRIVQTREY